MKRRGAILLITALLAVVSALGWKAWDVAVARRAADMQRQVVPRRVAAVTSVVESGPRSTVVVFFTTTCPFCRTEIASMMRHARSFGPRQIVLISPEDEATIRKFAREAGLTELPQLHVMRDSDPSLGLELQIRRVPTTLVYGADGLLVRQFEGLAPIGEILRAAGVGR